MFKKLLYFFSIAIALTISPIASNASIKEGDLCFSYASSLKAKFTCSVAFDGAQVSIDEIYKQGYRVVTMELTQHNLLIVIEKQ